MPLEPFTPREGQQVDQYWSAGELVEEVVWDVPFTGSGTSRKVSGETRVQVAAGETFHGDPLDRASELARAIAAANNVAEIRAAAASAAAKRRPDHLPNN